MVGEWIAHDGPMRIRFMLSEHLLNALKTCLRHGNPKADELLEEVKARKLEWRLKCLDGSERQNNSR